MHSTDTDGQPTRHRQAMPPGHRQGSRFGRIARTVGRVALGAALLGAGIGHLTTLREEFQAQVPDWMPIDHDSVVIVSGVAEIGLGLALILVPRAARGIVGTVSAAFFVAVFPGNIAQYLEGTDAFGLDSDRSRFVRLFFQPVLVAWALWSTSAVMWWRERCARRPTTH